jgi:uncharacterized membrane protein
MCVKGVNYKPISEKVKKNFTSDRASESIIIIIIIIIIISKVKVKFTLEQATKAQRWSRGIAPLFL